MKAPRSRCVVLACLTLALNVLASGCAIGGKSFSIDSNSRVPFFGLELKERKPKSAVPSYNSISRSNADQSRIEAALRVGPSSPNGLLKKGDKYLSAGSVAPEANSTSQAVAVTANEGHSKSLQLIPFPEIGEPKKLADRQLSSTVIDFQ